MAIVQKSENTAITIKGRTANSDAYTEQLAFTAVYLDFLRALDEFTFKQDSTTAALINSLKGSNVALLLRFAEFIENQFAKADAIAQGTQAIAGLMNGSYISTTFKSEGTVKS